jgi:hypothetical protein
VEHENNNPKKPEEEEEEENWLMMITWRARQPAKGWTDPRAVADGSS